MQPNAKNLNNIFSYHRPSGDQPDRYETIREVGRSLALEIVRLTSPSREQSLALTKLQECVMWANAGIAINGDGAAVVEDLEPDEPSDRTERPDGPSGRPSTYYAAVAQVEPTDVDVDELAQYPTGAK